MLGPKQYPGLAASYLSLPSLLVYKIQYPRPLGYCGCTYQENSEDFHPPSLWVALGGISPRPPAYWLRQYVLSGGRLRRNRLLLLPLPLREVPRGPPCIPPALTSLPYRYDDRGALSRSVRYPNNPTTRATATSPAPTPEYAPGGVVACAHDTRSLRILVAFMASKQDLGAGGLMPQRRGQPILPRKHRCVTPRQAMHGVYNSR